MKVEAYRCDFCGGIKEYEAITGINPTEDLFDRIKSFPICKPEKTNVHFCTLCYEKVVLNQARLIDRKRQENEYFLKLQELQYLLRESCVRNVRNKIKFARSE